mmetsp:Transcript_22854/g.67327  ORF Transcript_22854/g.67327 Transcript_22854/m.67327 type:complete len:353 (+) Transcript_22854:76-1134(+)
MDMEAAVKAVDDILAEKAFVEALKEFTERHCDVFEASDENKLEYTPIFEDYAKLVERSVESKLVERGVDLDAFMRDLPAYVESADAHPRTGAILETLMSFDSFSSFKDMMLEAKKAKASEGTGDGAGHVHTIHADVNGMSALDQLKDRLEVTSILEKGGAADGWTLIAEKKWIQSFRKKDPDSAINLTRCFAEVNVPADKLMDIFMDPLKKTEWDDEVSSCEIIGGEGYAKDGYVVRQVVKVPLINQREMIWRWIWIKDHPEPGAHTGVIYSEPWDEPPPPNTFRVDCKIGNVVVRPDPKDASRSRLTMFAQMDFGIPAFISNHMSHNWFVRNVIKLETAYKMMYGAGGAGA